MRLRTRLSLFFLGSLAVVLLGFSFTLYVLASKYLNRQTDERLEGALNTLAAAAEIGPEGVEWEPRERSVSFGRRTIEGRFCWQVCDPRGRRLDGSSTGDENLILEGQSSSVSKRPFSLADPRGMVWRVMYRRLETPPLIPRVGQETREEPSNEVRYEALILAAATSLEGVQATLRNLALVLAGLSLGLWSVALVCGRRLSRRALRPVTAMAESAHAIGGDGLDQRLPVQPSGDELEELGQSFNALLDRLQESFERQRRFTGDASHQLRTPLTAIQGQVDLALRQDRNADEYRRVLQLVQRKTRHLRQIVESLLFLARADSEALKPECAIIELNAWLEEHLRSWIEQERGRDLRLEITRDKPVLIRVQPALFAELIDNLLDNACRYSDPGTIIRVSVERDGASARLSVQDRGIGIADREIVRIFEPFYRTAEARRRVSHGLGLGLSVVQRLVKSIGGSIDVESQVGEGTRLTITLPIVPANSSPHPATEHHAEALPSGSTT